MRVWDLEGEIGVLAGDLRGEAELGVVYSRRQRNPLQLMDPQGAVFALVTPPTT